jgi:hypothetical protein
VAHRRDRPKLCIRVARARGLLGKDRQGSSSPYAILTLGAFLLFFFVLCVCVGGGGLCAFFLFSRFGLVWVGLLWVGSR